MSIEVSIVTLDKSLFSGEVDMVTLPGAEGQMGTVGFTTPEGQEHNGVGTKDRPGLGAGQLLHPHIFRIASR